MPNTKTVHVPHLGGIDAAYQMPMPYDSSKPTLVLVNSFTTSSDLYKSQFENKQLTDVMNLIAIELLGHGQTVRSEIPRSTPASLTMLDTSIMNLQVLEALGIKGNIFVLGTSQGGWITVRMALLAPEKIAGIIPLGTSMDFESERTRSRGCWDAPGLLSGSITEWTTTSPTPSFALQDDYCNQLVDLGFGQDCSSDARAFWVEAIKSNYTGDDGRKRLRMATINLRDRDGLHGRVADVRCPVLWMHGTADPVYSVPNAKEEIELFTNSADKKLQVVEGGQHFLSFSHPREVDAALVEFVGKYGK